MTALADWTPVESLRLATGIVWMALLVALWPAAWRVIRAAADLRPIEAIFGAVWVLALNRMTFTLVTAYLPGDQDALAVCYGFALFAGLNMLFAFSWACRVSARRKRG